MFLDDFEDLAELKHEHAGEAPWPAFARYLELRAIGVRAEAFGALNRFIEEARVWPYEDRLVFTRWLLDLSARIDRRALVPHNLLHAILLPTILEWRAHDPDQPHAHLWLGILGPSDELETNLERALALDPDCRFARRTLTRWIIECIRYNQHELPSFYIHDPRLDLPRLGRVLELTRGLEHEAWAGRARGEEPRFRRKAEAWLAAHPRPGDFAAH